MEFCNEEEEEEELALILHAPWRRAVKSKVARKRRKRRMWVRLILERRRSQGAFHKEMRQNDPEKHFGYLRMTKESFDILLHKVSY